MNLSLRKFRTFLGLTTLERRLAVKAVLLMAAVRFALWTIPFRLIRQRAEAFGGRRTTAPAEADEATAVQVAWAVKLASRYIPYASCLTQALTGLILLNQAGIENELHVGVALGGEGARHFEAHAWVEAAGRILIGGARESARYSRILTLRKPPV